MFLIKMNLIIAMITKGNFEKICICSVLVEYATALFRALPTLFPSPTASPTASPPYCLSASMSFRAFTLYFTFLKSLMVLWISTITFPKICSGPHLQLLRKEPFLISLTIMLWLFLLVLCLKQKVHIPP